MQKFKNTAECLQNEKWYMCPIPLATFLIFLFLFIYACFVLVKCSQLIQKAEELGTDAFELTYNKNLKSVTQLYVANLVMCILCIIVLTFFLYKALPDDQHSGLFNEYLGGIIILFLFIIVCWTLSFFQTVHTPERETSVIAVASIVLVFILIAIALYMYRIIQTTKLLNKKK